MPIAARTTRAIAKAPIHVYRWTLKPLIGLECRHLPTCSEYAVQAVGVSNIEAVAALTGAIPLVVPAVPTVGAISDLIEACAGFVGQGRGMS